MAQKTLEPVWLVETMHARVAAARMDGEHPGAPLTKDHAKCSPAGKLVQLSSTTGTHLVVRLVT